jgi:hypothetical protein
MLYLYLLLILRTWPRKSRIFVSRGFSLKLEGIHILSPQVSFQQGLHKIRLLNRDFFFVVDKKKEFTGKFPNHERLRVCILLFLFQSKNMEQLPSCN